MCFKILLKYAAVTGAILLLIGILATIYVISSFNTTRGFSIHAMMIAIGSTVFGLFLLIEYIFEKATYRIQDY